MGPAGSEQVEEVEATVARRARWRGALLALGLINLLVAHVGCWWVEPWREECGLSGRRPFSVRGIGCYGEERFLVLAWRWGLHRAWERPPLPRPIPRGYFGNAIPIREDYWLSLGLAGHGPDVKKRLDFSRVYALHLQARMGHGFARAGIIAAAQPGWTSDGEYRNVGIAIHSGWIAGLSAVPFLATYVIALVGRRPIAIGRCPICGYDLRATPERCPECGHVVASSGKDGRGKNHP